MVYSSVLVDQCSSSSIGMHENEHTAMSVAGRYKVPSTERALSALPSFLLCSASLTKVSFSRLE